MPTMPTQLGPIWKVLYEMSTDEERQEIMMLMIARVDAADRPSSFEIAQEIRQLLEGMGKDDLIKVHDFVSKLSAAVEIVRAGEGDQAEAGIFTAGQLQDLDLDWGISGAKQAPA